MNIVPIIVKRIPNHSIEFVLNNKNDFDYAVKNVQKFSLLKKCNVIFSPVYGTLNPSDLSQWILELKLPVRMQIQLQKYISVK